MYTMQYHMHSKCALWKFLILPGQRSCTWPIFKLHVTLDLKYIWAKFHYSMSNRSLVMVKTDRHTDRRTDRQTYKTIAWSIHVEYLINGIFLFQTATYGRKLSRSVKIGTRCGVWRVCNSKHEALSHLTPIQWSDIHIYNTSIYMIPYVVISNTKCSLQFT